MINCRGSKCLVPFSVALTQPSDPVNFYFTRITQPLRAKMDLATNPVLKSFLAGSFSGTCSTILFQPLDLIKTRVQNNASKSSNHKAIAVFRQVLRTERVVGLWRGVTPSITRTVPGVGLYFGSLHWLQSVTGETKPSSPLSAVCLGAAARTVAAAAMIPVTVVKARFESGQYNYQRMSHAFSSIYTREGVRGLCLGLAPTVVRDAPFSGLYLMFYTQLKHHLPTEDTKDRSSLANFSCGLVAGFLASTVTHPADVVKTKMQLHPSLYSSVRVTVFKVMTLSGPRGFLVGLAPRMLRRTLMAALAWTVYEEIMKNMGLK